MISIAAFVPSCTGVMWTLDQFRFGDFEFPNHAEINDWRVQRYLAEPAKEIQMRKSGGGFHAKFRIEKKPLDSWFEKHWQAAGSGASNTKKAPTTVSGEYVGFVFRERGWSIPKDAALLQYQGPRAANGAGSTIYFDPADKVAYQQAGYW